MAASTGVWDSIPKWECHRVLPPPTAASALPWPGQDHKTATGPPGSGQQPATEAPADHQADPRPYPASGGPFPALPNARSVNLKQKSTVRVGGPYPAPPSARLHGSRTAKDRARPVFSYAARAPRTTRGNAPGPLDTGAPPPHPRGVNQ